MSKLRIAALLCVARCELAGCLELRSRDNVSPGNWRIKKCCKYNTVFLVTRIIHTKTRCAERIDMKCSEFLAILVSQKFAASCIVLHPLQAVREADSEDWKIKESVCV